MPESENGVRLVAGRREDIVWEGAPWVIWDAGVSGCGLVKGNVEKPETLDFAGSKKKIKEWVAQQPVTNLVIEAPLSAAFRSDGQPIGREGEKDDSGQARYWYMGAGAGVMLATLYLLRDLQADSSAGKHEVRLFEGLVSFKTGGKNSDHAADVTALRNVVKGCPGAGGKICEAAPMDNEGDIESIGALLGVDLGGIPPMIIAAAP